MPTSLRRRLEEMLSIPLRLFVVEETEFNAIFRDLLANVTR